MKKIEKEILKIYNAVIAAIIALLGFTTSCVREVEYGAPYAKFIINGKVESSETNEGIEGIQVETYRYSSHSYTDQQGLYKTIVNDGPAGDCILLFSFDDIDDTVNGAFENLDAVLEVKDPVFSKGDGEWYKGEITLEFNVQLKPKK